jgi:serine/threonine protein kinase
MVYHALDHSQQKEENKHVAIKFMRNEAQWRQELVTRCGNAENGALDEAFVIGVLRAYNADEEKEQFRKDLEARDLQDYPYVLVMPRADRSLADVLKHEHLAPSPDEVHWAEVRVITQHVAKALVHLHGRDIIHGDLKPV